MLNLKKLFYVLICVSIVLSLQNNLEAGKVYTWTDASGIVHYSDKPFPQAKVSKTIRINPRTATIEEEAEAEQTANEIESALEKATEVAASNANDNEVNVSEAEEKCQKAEANLKLLNTESNSLTLRSPTGEVTVLNSADIQAQRTKNQAFWDANCSKELTQ